MLTQKYFQINKCIYCGGVGETKEHVIPFALGGTMVLKNASCEKCRDSSSRCERNPLNKNFAEVRALLDLPSRKRVFANEKFPLKVVLRDGQEKTLELSSRDTLGLIQFLEYGPPGFFNPNGYTAGISVTGVRTISFGKSLEELLKDYDVKSVNITIQHKGNDFERMVARIAYTYVVAFWGLDCFDKRLVLPAIMGGKDDIGMWVGCDHVGNIFPLIGKVSGRNAMKLGVFKKAGDKERYITVRIKFFATSDSPEYLVVVGTLKNNFTIPC